MIDILLYIGALLIGLILGLIGGGGSILTVPILHYIAGIPTVLSTAYSLFVVGSTAGFGAFKAFKRGHVSIPTAILFVIPSSIATNLTRQFIIPNILETILEAPIHITKDSGMILFFGLLMLIISINMLKKKKQHQRPQPEIKYNYPLMIGVGLSVGLLAGLVGAGGGFLIVPALVLWANLPVKLAIGTSLSIISVQSMVGFLGDLQTQTIDWPFLIPFALVAIVGILIGSHLSKNITGKKIRKLFGTFVLIMAIIILTIEIVNL